MTDNIKNLEQQVDQAKDLTTDQIHGLMIELLKQRLENAKKGHRLAAKAHHRALTWGPWLDLAFGVLNGAAAVWNIALGYPVVAVFNLVVGAWCMWAWTQRHKKVEFWSESHDFWHKALAEIVTDGKRIGKNMGISEEEFDRLMAERRTHGTSDVR